MEPAAVTGPKEAQIFLEEDIEAGLGDHHCQYSWNVGIDVGQFMSRQKGTPL